MERDNLWLQSLLDDIWDRHFADVPQNNVVRIEFGRRARTRLGSIKRNATAVDETIITMNGLFKLDELPELIVRGTIAHELVHYAHGFHSPLPQKYRHPHAGGIVEREYKLRGLFEQHVHQKRWLKSNWPQFLETHLPSRKRRQKSVVVKSTLGIGVWRRW